MTPRSSLCYKSANGLISGKSASSTSPVKRQNVKLIASRLISTLLWVHRRE